MKKALVTIFLFYLTVFSFICQQEKRLALVIGNANYDKGELENPLRDAKLIKETLDSLGFEVLYHENLIDSDAIYKSIKEFTKKLDSSDVSMIYYAGHGIQVDGKNYLVPTKVELTDEGDVVHYCYCLDNLMKSLSEYANKVNVIVLDACRDNPFESKWRGKSYGAKGLIGIESPDGCIIAYSTKTGKVASDNSFYAKYLAQYMQEPGLEIKNVFQKVRVKVNDVSNGEQTPVETHQMFSDFYFIKSSFEIQFHQIDNLIENKNYLGSLEIIGAILEKDPNNPKALIKRAKIYFKKNNDINTALVDLNKCIDQNPNYYDAYIERANLYNNIDSIDSSLDDYISCIKINPENPIAYNKRADLYFKIGDYEKSLEDLDEAIRLYPENEFFYFSRGKVYLKIKEYNKSLEDFNTAIIDSPEYSEFYYYRARSYDKIGKLKKALDDIKRSLELNPDNYIASKFKIELVAKALNNKSQNFKNNKQEMLDELQKETEKRQNQIDPKDPNPFILESRRYLIIGNDYSKLGYEIKSANYYYKAINEMTIAIQKLKENQNLDYFLELDSQNRLSISDLFLERAEFYKLLNIPYMMCEDYQYALENLNEAEKEAEKRVKEIIKENCK